MGKKHMRGIRVVGKAIGGITRERVTWGKVRMRMEKAARREDTMRNSTIREKGRRADMKTQMMKERRGKGRRADMRKTQMMKEGRGKGRRADMRKTQMMKVEKGKKERREDMKTTQMMKMEKVRREKDDMKKTQMKKKERREKAENRTMMVEKAAILVQGLAS